MSPSPMLQAIDLMRVNIDAMNLEELEAHAQQVLDVLGGLNDYINSPGPKSSNAKRGALHQARKLRAHMARVRDLINARQQAAAMVATMQAAGSVSLAPGVRAHACARDRSIAGQIRIEDRPRCCGPAHSRATNVETMPKPKGGAWSWLGAC